MCSLIQDAIKTFENQDEKEKMANDALNVMLELAEQQKDAFKLKITNGNVDTKTIPIGQIIHSDWHVRCGVGSDAGQNVSDMISKSYSAFTKGGIMDGIAEVIKDGLDVLLGSYMANTSKRELYTITTGALGGIQRVDVSLYSYRFTAKQLTEITKNVVSAAVVISSVDAKSVTEATIRVLVQNQFPAEKQQEVLDILLKAHREALGTGI